MNKHRNIFFPIKPKFIDSFWMANHERQKMQIFMCTNDWPGCDLIVKCITNYATTCLAPNEQLIERLMEQCIEDVREFGHIDRMKWIFNYEHTDDKTTLGAKH